MALVDAFLQEIENEAKTTRRVLERVPEDKYAWKPHPKSMSLGQLALHLAQSAGYCDWICNDVFEFTGDMGPREPANKAELLKTLDDSVAKAKETLPKVGDAGLMKMWKAVAGGNTMMEMPKAAVVRVVACNHTYHHRGQLSVYLRLLDVPVPSIYRPSADEGRG